MIPQKIANIILGLSSNYSGTIFVILLFLIFVGTFMEGNAYIVILAPLSNTPAEKAGLKPGDRILAVDGKDMTGVGSGEAVTYIRGDKGTEVILTIFPKDSDNFLKNSFPIEYKFLTDIEKGKYSADEIEKINKKRVTYVNSL
jgi:C-terminal processing protease CtpA/Prc